MRGIHRWPVNSTHKVPVTWKIFDDAIMRNTHYRFPSIGNMSAFWHMFFLFLLTNIRDKNNLMIHIEILMIKVRFHVSEMKYHLYPIVYVKQNLQMCNFQAYTPSRMVFWTTICTMLTMTPHSWSVNGVVTSTHSGGRRETPSGSRPRDRYGTTTVAPFTSMDQF